MRERAPWLVFCLATSLVAPVLLVSCNDDGRTLRPAGPNQTASVSTLAPITTPTDGSGATIAPTTTIAVAPTLVAPFGEGEAIPARYTCDDANVSPALSWAGAPGGTVEIALAMVDLDAPGYLHWVLAGLDPAATAVGEALSPEYGLAATNSDGTVGYVGPCPSAGQTHRYQLNVYFLAQKTELGRGAPGADMLNFISSVSLSVASVTGTYSKAAA